MLSTQYPWLNTRQYPFATREFDSGEGWMSYVDQGQGRPIVFVHGSMTWSFLFRHLIRAYAGRYRCIAPDHLGFGLSEKPRGVDYGPEGATARLERLMEHLNLRDVTLVLHDFGGPVGLEWATRHPNRVRDIIMFNSWAWSLADNLGAQRLAKLYGNPLNRFYYRVLNASPSFILPTLFADRHRLPRPTQMQYMEPFRRQVDREGVYGLVESWRSGTPFYERLWERRHLIAHKRMLLLWGMKDPLFGPAALDRFRAAFREHTAITFPTGRFLPEERGEEAADEIGWFLLNSVPARVR
ncbi:MAG: alpha/beta hydrolase [Armatimonadota bacterium]